VPKKVYEFLKTHEGKAATKKRQTAAAAVAETKAGFYKQQAFTPHPQDEHLYVYIARMNAAIKSMMLIITGPLQTTVGTKR
jgi:hypothetical protein